MSPSQQPRAAAIVRFAVVVLLVGLGAGVSGLVVSLLLHGLEHLAFGYSAGSFLDGVVASAPDRRVIALVIAGLVGGIGWWALRRWGRPVVTVEAGVEGARMPLLTTLVNAGLQIVIVGLGASIGRELAPRELAALVASRVAEWTGVSARERRILIACGAGAGLAAVYNVPLGGALFAVEILLAELAVTTIVPALAASAIATVVAWLVVPMGPLYEVPHVSSTPSLLVWSVVAGPVIGLLAIAFTRGARFAEAIRPRGWPLLVVMPAVFAGVGAASIALPAILGNGKALGQVAFTESVPVLMLVVLLAAKAIATLATIGSGAAGGTLTPSLAIGACAGGLLGALWGAMWPGTALAAFALVGAAAFLATSMRAPLTAVVLVIEFTGQGAALLVPTLLAVAGAMAVSYVVARPRITGVD